jgi:hypothetical protein
MDNLTNLRVKTIIDGAYDLDEALDRLKFKKEILTQLRIKIKSSKVIPEIVIDHQVHLNYIQNNLIIFSVIFI